MMIAGALDLIRKPLFIAFAADKNLPILNILARSLIGRGTEIFAAQVKLDVVGMRAVQTIHPDGHPSSASFEKSHAQLWKSIEHPMINHPGKGNDQRERVAERVNRHKGFERVQPHAVMGAAVHAERAPEPL